MILEALNKFFNRSPRKKTTAINELLDYERGRKRKKVKELGEVFREVSSQTRDFASHLNGAAGK